MQVIFLILGMTLVSYLIFCAFNLIMDLPALSSYDYESKKSFLIQKYIGLLLGIGSVGLFVINHSLAGLVFGLGTIILNLIFYNSNVAVEGKFNTPIYGQSAKGWHQFGIFIGTLFLVASILLFFGVFTFGWIELIPFKFH